MRAKETDAVMVLIL